MTIGCHIRQSLEQIAALPLAPRIRLALAAVREQLDDEIIARIERVANGLLDRPPEAGLIVALDGVITSTAEVMLLGRLASLLALPLMSDDAAFDHMAAASAEIEALRVDDVEPFQDRLRLYCAEKVALFDAHVARSWSAGKYRIATLAPEPVAALN